MEFRLNRRYEDEEYRKILMIIKSFKAIKTENGWYLPSSMYKSMVEAFKLNIGYDPTEPMYGMNELYHVIFKDKVDKPEMADILRKAQFDPDTGIFVMDAGTFKHFAEFCEDNSIKYYLLQDAEKTDVWEKETTLSLLRDIKDEMEKFDYRSILSTDALFQILRSLNDNQIKLAQLIGEKIKKLYEEIEVEKETGDKVMFYYLSLDPVMLIVRRGQEQSVFYLKSEDIITLDRNVAEQLVKMKRGKILEEKRTGTEGEEGA